MPLVAAGLQCFSGCGWCIALKDQVYIVMIEYNRIPYIILCTDDLTTSSSEVQEAKYSDKQVLTHNIVR